MRNIYRQRENKIERQKRDGNYFGVNKAKSTYTHGHMCSNIVIIIKNSINSNNFYSHIKYIL